VNKIAFASTLETYLPVEFSLRNNLEKIAPKKSPRANGELVLVIDDEAAIRQVVQRTLEAFGYRVVTAEGGPQALSIYVQRQAEIGTVITDMMMPYMSGVATISALLKVNSGVRIIVLTGFSSEAQKEAAMAAGATEFLAKPFTIEKLLETLSHSPT
jgi:two-component system, cell cycle sensor histidine kinase and response regulator CckA